MQTTLDRIQPDNSSCFAFPPQRSLRYAVLGLDGGARAAINHSPTLNQRINPEEFGVWAASSPAIVAAMHFQNRDRSRWQTLIRSHRPRDRRDCRNLTSEVAC